MAYNNTNKDKLQHNLAEEAKRWLVAIILLIILISSVVSIYQQATSLYQAKKRNDALREEINKLNREKIDLKRKIEYATSSAGLARRKAGNDYGLIMPETVPTIIDDNDSIPIEKPKVIQWLELFTKKNEGGTILKFF